MACNNLSDDFPARRPDSIGPYDIRSTKRSRATFWNSPSKKELLSLFCSFGHFLAPSIHGKGKRSGDVAPQRAPPGLESLKAWTCLSATVISQCFDPERMMMCTWGLQCVENAHEKQNKDGIEGRSPDEPRQYIRRQSVQVPPRAVGMVEAQRPAQVSA